MLLAIIADDLTGSNDSSVQFARLGLRVCTVLPGSKPAPDADFDVLVLDSESRDIDAGAAYEAVHGMARESMRFGPGMFYKKVDSTLRGNIGAEIRAMADAVDPSLIVVAPAFIAAGRTTVDGMQLLNGVRLEETELARIPKSPIKSSDIAEIIRSQAEFSISRVSTADIGKGAGFLAARFTEMIAAERGRLVVCDCTAEAHLDLLARALEGTPNVLFVGSAGLALALSRRMPAQAARRRKPACDRVLVLSGSISEVTRGQTNRLLAEFPGAGLLHVDPLLAVTSPRSAAEACAREVRERLSGASVLVVSAALRESDVEACRSAGERIGISFFQVGECVARTMAEIMVLLADDFPSFIMTGGDTAVHACAAVSAGVLSPLDEIAPGIPVCEILSGRHGRKLLVTKAGAFGQEDAFVKAVKYLFGNSH